MGTVRDRIKRSMRLIGAIAAGETPAAEELADALESLNAMIGEWSNEKLLIYSEDREIFDLVAGTASYTIGEDGTYDTSRPQKIERAAIRVGTQEFPVEVINLEQFASIPIKASTSTIPQRLYYNTTAPLGTITLWPTPSAAEELVLYSWKPLTEFASVATTVSLPPGYNQAIDTNLAVVLAPEYGKPVSADLARLATESKAAIKRMNIKPHLLSVDLALRSTGSFNINEGD